MYKMIVVDDEKYIRNGLTKFINNENLGFNVVENFSDGLEAIEYINSNIIDVVLTDIRMLQVSGLEVAKYIYENELDIKVIIISGHKEFDYAKKAMEYNVKNYLLKPTDFNEVRSVFGEIKILLDNERTNKNDNKNYYELISALKEEFYVDLATGMIKDENEVNKKINMLGIGEDGTSCPCSIIDMEISNYSKYIEKKWEYGKEGLNNAIINVFNEEFNDLHFVLVFVRSSNIRIFAISKKPIGIKHFKEICISKLEEIFNELKKMFDIELEIKTNKWFTNIFEVVNLKGELETIVNTASIDESKNDSSSDMVINGAQKFIDENYHRDISLQDVADHVFLSSKYFSRVFKETTGENFSEYLVRVRMNHAIILIKNNIKIDTVSSKVGYNSTKYFSRIFKQYTGHAPKEYARLLNSKVIGDIDEDN